MKRIAFILLFIGLTNQAVAADEDRTYPHGCRQLGFNFDDDKLVLSQIDNGQIDTLYLIRNNSPYEIILETDKTNSYMPTFKKTLPTQQWAAFSRIEKQLKFNCRLSPEYQSDQPILRCRDTLQICNYNNAKFPRQNLGTYWLQKTSLHQKAVMDFAIDKGILLRW